MSSSAAEFIERTGTAWSPFTIIVSIILIYLFTTWTYSAYFSPLASYDGPRFWAASYLPYSYYQMTGVLPYKIAELHARYGSVVRISPMALSYIDDRAWGDGFAKTRPQLKKDPNVGPPPPNGVKGLAFVDDDADHARMRRNLALGFSEKALREQEELLHGYFDLFVVKLREKAKEGSVNVIDFLNFVTTDIIGELTFGRSFDCLTSSTLHPWMENIYSFLKAFVTVGVLARFEPLGFLILFVAKYVPGFAEKERLHRGFINDRLDARLSMNPPRTDFMTYVQKNTGTRTGMSIAELQETCNALMIGGSETVASALSGGIYFLLKNPARLAKLQKEVRTAFETKEDITFAGTSGLEYLHAVLQETLRIFPPVSIQITRITSPGGNTIASRYVPEGTSVTVSHWAAYHSPTNFHLPDSFCPERWLPESETYKATPEFENDNKKVVQPFSVGPRNCIGINLAWAELRMLLATLVWTFDWELDEKSREWDHGMKIWALYEKAPLLLHLREVVR